MAACSMSATARSSSSGSWALTAMRPVVRRMPWPAVRSASCWRTSLVLRGLLGVLDLADPLTLGGVGDVLGLLLADVAGGLVGAHRRVEQRERAPYPRGQQYGCEEAGVDERAWPFADPEHAVVRGVAAHARPGLGDGDGAGGGEVAAEVAVALQGAGDDGVVRRAEDHGEVARLQPARRGRGRPRGVPRVMVDISWRSTAAAPRLPPPAARIARPAAFMSSEIDTVLAWRSPAGPARSISSPYVVEVQESSWLPCWDHHSARPLPESGSVRSITWTRSDASGAASGGEHAAPARDPALLLERVEQDERWVGDADDGGQRRGVRVVDHDRAALGVEPLTQTRRIARQRERASGSRLHDATAEQQLTAGGPPEPAADDGQPLDRACGRRHRRTPALRRSAARGRRTSGTGRRRRRGRTPA